MASKGQLNGDRSRRKNTEDVKRGSLKTSNMERDTLKREDNKENTAEEMDIDENADDTKTGKPDLDEKHKENENAEENERENADQNTKLRRGSYSVTKKGNTFNANDKQNEKMKSRNNISNSRTRDAKPLTKAGIFKKQQSRQSINKPVTKLNKGSMDNNINGHKQDSTNQDAIQEKENAQESPKFRDDRNDFQTASVDQFNDDFERYNMGTGTNEWADTEDSEIPILYSDEEGEYPEPRPLTDTDRSRYPNYRRYEDDGEHMRVNYRDPAHKKPPSPRESPVRNSPLIVTIINNLSRDKREKVILNPQTQQTFEKWLEDISNPDMPINSFSALFRELRTHSNFLAVGEEGLPAEVAKKRQAPSSNSSTDSIHEARNRKKKLAKQQEM
ncbi:hypothetical protein MAR_004653, partial [Mya arenaria]